MATSAYVKALLGGVPAELKAALQRSFEYVFDRSFEFGPVDHQEPSANFRGVYLKVTTSSVANQEVAVAHGLGRTPNVCIPVMKPNAVNSRLVGDLTMARAADASRLYLASASTGAVVYLYAE